MLYIVGYKHTLPNTQDYLGELRLIVKLSSPYAVKVCIEAESMLTV